MGMPGRAAVAPPSLDATVTAVLPDRGATSAPRPVPTPAPARGRRGWTRHVGDRHRAGRDGPRRVRQRLPRPAGARPGAGRRGHRARRPRSPRSSTAATPSPSSTAIPDTNIELRAARERGVPTLRRAGMLAAICAQARSIGVAGTHGKTTTTSMLMLILAEAGLAPSFIVGGDVMDAGTGAHWTGGELLVVEADESDGTHVELPLAGTILLNVELDFLQHYGTFDALLASFDRYLAHIDGPKVLCADDPVCADLATPPPVDHLRARRRPPTCGPSTCSSATGSFSFAVERVDGRTSASATSSCRCAACTTSSTPPAPSPWRSSSASPFEACREALARFGGVARRFDIRGVDGGATFVDDYGHLPTEIAAVIAAARDSGDGWGRVVVAFQPNRYNRIAEMWQEYRDAFVGADVVVITEIYPSGTTPIPGVTGRLIVNAVVDAHPRARVLWLPRREDVVSFLAGEVGQRRRVHLDGVRRHRHRPRGGAGPAGGTEGDRDRGRRPARERPARITGDRAIEPLGPLTTYRVGGAAALFVPRPRARRPARRRRGSSRSPACPCWWSASGPTCSSPTPGSTGSRSAWPRWPAPSTSATTHVVTGRGRRGPAQAGAPHGRPRPHRVRVGGRRAGFDRRRGEDERRRPRLRHRLVPARRRRPRPRRRRPCPPVTRKTEELGLRFRGSDVGDDEVVLSARLQLAAGRPRDGRGGDRRDRAVAPGAPARRPELRLRLRQPGAGRGQRRQPGRRPRPAGLPDRDGVGLRQARQLHPGRRRRLGRRRAGRDRGRARGASPTRPGSRLRSEVRLVGFGDAA